MYTYFRRIPRGYINTGAKSSLTSVSEEFPHMDATQQRDLSQRLSRIGGQVQGIKKMVDEGQDAAAILVQLMALQKATRAAATFLVKAQATERIRAQIRTALASCPGDCDHCDELVAIDHALNELDFDSLLQAHLKIVE
jgi:DNA-binding FrmR family transcriptional regulator